MEVGNDQGSVRKTQVQLKYRVLRRCEIDVFPNYPTWRLRVQFEGNSAERSPMQLVENQAGNRTMPRRPIKSLCRPEKYPFAPEQTANADRGRVRVVLSCAKTARD